MQWIFTLVTYENNLVSLQSIKYTNPVYRNDVAIITRL